jgi:hypothetical protein
MRSFMIGFFAFWSISWAILACVMMGVCVRFGIWLISVVSSTYLTTVFIWGNLAKRYRFVVVGFVIKKNKFTPRFVKLWFA